MNARTSLTEYQRRYEELSKKANELGHTAKNTGTGELDQVQCTCGWKSKDYFDGSTYAWGAWETHAEEVVQNGQGELPLTQPLCVTR